MDTWWVYVDGFQQAWTMAVQWVGSTLGLSGALEHWTQDGLFTPESLNQLAAALALVAVIAALIAVHCYRRLRSSQITSKVKAVKEFVVPGEGPRFRKRDRLAFMSRKAYRSAKAVGSYIRGGQGRKRKDMAKLMKRVFSHPSSPDNESQILKPDLPHEYLEEDGSYGSDAQDGAVPESVLLVLKNLRVFGYIEHTAVWKLMADVQYVNLKVNDVLFKVGDPDESMFIVESGRVQVSYDASEPGAETRNIMEMKLVKAGEPIVSLLSFLDYMANKRKAYKTVSARALEESRIIRFPFASFQRAFASDPESLARVVQVVMIRLQRVTFLALHQYLGLGAELMNSQHRGAVHPKRQASTDLPRAKHEDVEDGPAASRPPLPSRSISVPASKPTHNAIGSHEASPVPYPFLEDPTLKDIFKSKKILAGYPDDKLLDVAVSFFRKHFGLSDEDMVGEGSAGFVQDLDIVQVPEKGILVAEESSDGPMLFLVLTGCVGVSQRNGDGVPVEIHKAYPGGVLGQLQVLTGEPSFFTYTSLMPSKIAILNGKELAPYMLRNPDVALLLASSVIDNLSSYVRSIDFALEWNLVESGKALYKQNSVADSTYVVLSGRLRSVISRHGGKKELVGEFGRGELTGIVETLMKTPRSTTVIAVRDTEVAKLPSGLIDYIKMRFPIVLMRLIKLLGEKLQQSWEKGSDPRSLALSSSTSMHHVAQSNFSTVAIIGLTPDLPVTSFSLELLQALNKIDGSVRLTQEYIVKELGGEAFHKGAEFRLSAWLAQQEDKHRIVMYQCDPELNSWTKLCVRHADVIFILVDPTTTPHVRRLEENLETYSRRTRKEMIFLHKEDVRYPKNTSLWLRDRNWINVHYHVRCPPRMFFKKHLVRVESMYNRIAQDSPLDIHSDFSRLARMVTGTSVGLVLGGGGARGCSHVGIIKAILEAGIPIDTVAGVSIGSFIGALYCQERNVTEMTVKARSFSYKMTQYWRQVMDLTWPHTAYFTGQGFNDLLEEMFQDKDIRDLWLPYFTVTTDITESAMRLHDYGSLWRYVRSSMSLAGYMPPLCDPHDGHLLLDGGYVNNLPADIMRMKGAKHILAVDVGAHDDADFTNYGDTLSGLQVLLSKWSPFRSKMIVPNQAEIQSRLAYVSCVGKLETVKNSDYCHYLRPPIDRYGTLQFGAFEEIRDVGYYHGKTYFTGLKKAGLLKQFMSPTKGEKAGPFSLQGAIRRGSVDQLATPLDTPKPTSNSSNFTNLAEMVCSVQKPFPTQDSGAEDPMVDLDDEDQSTLGTDESDELITDEEDDTESGFLSQM
eukprot:snap_masked-scaffold753_size102382-processed-gene-0.9 protein:Tk10722 transcript:snap_masked-scaffold753_size102382-processed-gene-0.9-mRNA-1 annotation:"neuropathy target esterase sws isoform x1"